MPKRREELALGLMSGTSADGVSLALIDARRRARVLAHATYAYAPVMRRRILAAPELKAADLAELDFELGRLFARSAARFLRAAGVSARRLSAVGSHGQTVAHRPGGRAPATLQIGEASFLAEQLGADVVSDFRPRDISAGGEGAPIVPAFDEFLFGGGRPAVLQNIGGIANAALVGKGIRTVAYDTGPGNCLIDLAVSSMTGGRLAYDRGGRIAASGRADERLARRLARAPYFLRKAPKTLDRSSFAEPYLKKHFPAFARRGADAVATLTFFTALTIADSYARCLGPIRSSKVVVSGGGALNPVLLGHLRSLLPAARVEMIDEYGIPAMAKEAAAMAWMAHRALRGLTNHSPEATGARGARVLGKITRA